MKYAFLTLSTFFFILAGAQNVEQRDFIKVQQTFKVSLAELTTYGYGTSSAGANSDRQPIASEKDAEIFLDKLVTNRRKDFNVDVAKHLESSLTKYANGSAILFFQQPFDTKKLFGGPAAKKINDEYKKICEEAKILKNSLTEIQKKIKENIQGGTTRSAIVSTQLSPSFVSELNQLRNLEASYLSQIKELETKMDQLKAKFDEARDQIVQEEKIESFVLNKEKRMDSDVEFSNYLLEKDDILLVLLGGENGLAKSKIKLEHLPTSFEIALNDLKDLAVATGVKLPVYADDNNCKIPNPEDSVAISFIYLKKNKIRFPSLITLSNEKLKSDLKFDIHEKTYLGIKVGVSVLANVDRKQFLLENDELTIKLDSVQKQEWKANLMAFFEIYPFGRDIDRISSIFKHEKSVPFTQRIGIAAGIRISNDPLQTFFTGFSIALTKEFSVTFGTAFNKVPEDVTALPVGENATLDYLKKNAAEERKMNFYFGLAISPGGMMKLLGLKK